MRTTIDKAGRIVIPMAVRDALGLREGQVLNVTVRTGRIVIEPASGTMRLVKRRGFLAAEIVGEQPPRLTTRRVRTLLDRARR